MIFPSSALTGALLALAALTPGARLAAVDWPQWLGPRRDAVWRETGILQAFPPAGPPVRWRTPVGAGYSGPAVAADRVYLTDRVVVERTGEAGDPFARGRIPGKERVLCLDAADGRLLWQHEYDCTYTMSYPAGPRATPLVADGKVFTLGAEGNLFCLDAARGTVIWQHDFVKDFQARTPLWGFAGHPLLDGQRLICTVGADEGLAMAFNKDTGEVMWRALRAREPGYAPPTLIHAAGRRQLVVWHPESVNALDPETSEVLWTEPWAIRSGLSVSQPRQSGDTLFLTAFYNGPLMLRLGADRPSASVVWRGPKTSERDTWGLHSIIPTPFLEGGHIYGVCSYGQLRCLRADTGERVWETFAATTGGEPVRWANAFLVKHADRFFLFNEKGDLIIARLSPEGYQEISRAHLLEPTNTAAGRPVLWMHPAFAKKSLFGRNDRELICVSLAAKAP